MRIVAAVGGNALLQRGQAPDASTQWENARAATAGLARLAHDHQVVITHGNGPQIGLLALEDAAFGKLDPYPLDVLGAESQGMVGYLLLQGLTQAAPLLQVAYLLSRVVVDPTDPAFSHPTKPIGPGYDEATALGLAEKYGWRIARDGESWRRVVASPEPRSLVEIAPIRLLVDDGLTAICGGGGGIPVIRTDHGLTGVEAVVDKDFTAGLIAKAIDADMLLILTDVPGVAPVWPNDIGTYIRQAGADTLSLLAFEAGSMKPKIEAASRFARSGRPAVIASLADAERAVAGEAGTLVLPHAEAVEQWDRNIDAA